MDPHALLGSLISLVGLRFKQLVWFNVCFIQNYSFILRTYLLYFWICNFFFFMLMLE